MALKVAPVSQSLYTPTPLALSRSQRFHFSTLLGTIYMLIISNCPFLVL